MDFGRVSIEQLDRINFTLPGEPTENLGVLKGGKGDTKYYVGLGKWGRKEWIGKLYPKGTKDSDFLIEYAQHFNCIELNATHYKLFKPEEIQAWKAKVSLHSDFLFCPKVYNAITHVGTLRDKKFLTDVFLDSLTYFGNNLGPIFLQMSDKFGPQRKDELVTYLRTLPKNYQFFLEIRHPEWFDVRSKNIFSALQDLNIGTVITDAAGRRDVVHMHLTTAKVVIRYIGNNGHPTDYKRLSEWVERIMYWKESGLREVYFFVHSVDEAFSPELASYMIQELNDKCKAGLKEINLQDP
jgi:uncharacterized protein YecE (DUF72 family)